ANHAALWLRHQRLESE
ncbi:hypothetical protein D030_2046B, partial [Vibrio parahaemolyticus AQ3810]